MAIKNDREYRSIAMAEFRAAEEPDSFIVEGYATTFNDPYVMFEYDGIQYKEQISDRAFENCDMSDVLFLYNHDGRVLARQKSGTLQLSMDEHGLKVRADLGSTSASREMYEDIKAGLVDQMSWAFSIRADEYNQETHTRTITEVKKIYDVSAVSIPANPNTDIGVSARSYFDGVIEAEKAERLNEAREKLRLKIRLQEEK